MCIYTHIYNYKKENARRKQRAMQLAGRTGRGLVGPDISLHKKLKACRSTYLQAISQSLQQQNGKELAGPRPFSIKGPGRWWGRRMA